MCLQSVVTVARTPSQSKRNGPRSLPHGSYLRSRSPPALPNSSWEASSDIRAFLPNRVNDPVTERPPTSSAGHFPAAIPQCWLGTRNQPGRVQWWVHLSIGRVGWRRQQCTTPPTNAPPVLSMPKRPIPRGAYRNRLLSAETTTLIVINVLKASLS